MAYNELIFILQTITISGTVLGALLLGKEALIVLMCVQSILANLLVTQQITLCGLHATASDAFIVGSVIGLNLLQEYWGKAAARLAILLTTCSLALYTVLSQLHLLYVPSSYDTMHPHLHVLLAPMPRIMLVGLGVFFVVQQWDYWLYGLLKKKTNGRYLLVRNYVCLATSQLLDTILFTFGALSGLVHNAWEVIAVSYTIKLCAVLLCTPLLLIAGKAMRRGTPKGL